MTASETLKCQFCKRDTPIGESACTKCGHYLKSELECARSIDHSLIILRRIAIWFLVLSILCDVFGLLVIILR